MALSFIIEYLASRPRGDSFLLVQSAMQTIIPAVPAGVQFTLAQIPAGNDYAAIVYKSALVPDMVPDAFFFSVQYAGSLFLSGIVNSYWFRDSQDSYLIISRKQPSVLTIRNRTNVPQYYGGVAYFLRVRTEDNYREVREELERVGSQKIEGLSREANQLLSALTQRLGVPRPPVGGG